MLGERDLVVLPTYSDQKNHEQLTNTTFHLLSLELLILCIGKMSYERYARYYQGSHVYLGYPIVCSEVKIRVLTEVEKVPVIHSVSLNNQNLFEMKIISNGWILFQGDIYWKFC